MLVSILLLSSCGPSDTVELTVDPVGDPRQLPRYGDDFDRLTDNEVVARSYERAFRNHASHADLTVALTINLENAVLAGGFGQYFLVYGIERAVGAAAAYREIGRDDLADTVERARAVALTTDAVRVFDRTAFQSLNATFWTRLKRDPTEARARYLRDAEVKLAR